MPTSLNLVYTPAQGELFFELPKIGNRVVIPKGRRFGATYGACQFCVESMMKDNKTILWVDTIQSNLDAYYNRYFLPILQQIDKSAYSYNISKHELTLVSSDNKTKKCYFRSAERPENLEGFAYDIMILNEAGIILSGQHGRNLWYNSLLPMTLDYNPVVFFLGTPKGKMAKKHEHSETGKSLYYELACKGGLDNNPITPGWVTKTYSSYDNPHLNQELIAEIETDVPYAIRQQEIHGKFLDAGTEEIFKNEWFHIQDNISVPVIRKIISADTAFKKGSSNDHTALVVISETHNSYVIEDCICKQLEYPELLTAVTELYNRNSEALALLVEDKASGQSLIQSLKTDSKIPVIPVQSTSDKVTRANAVTGLFESGRVSLLKDASWNRMLIDQLCSFSAALDTPDDIVDAVTQGLTWLKTRQKIGAPIVTRSIMRVSPVLRGY